MKKYLREEDVLGTWPKMTYKKHEVFGTTCGGCLSICAKIGIGFYVAVIFISFFTSPDYNVDYETLYQRLSDPQTYTLSPIDFVPITLIQDKDGTIERDLYQVSYDVTEWKSFSDNYPTLIESKPAIDCKTYADKYMKGTDAYDEFVEELSQELYDMPQAFYCPDYETYDLVGGFHRGTDLRLKINISQEKQEQLAAGTLNLAKL